MQMWLFFTIFGLVLFVPTGLLFLLLNRFKNTIVLLIKQNGSLRKIIITNKDLEVGQITKIKGKSVKPIKISKEEIYYGKWRRWIVKPELDSKKEGNISDKEIEEYLNNEDLLKLYLAGKFKDTLILLLSAIIFIMIVGFVVLGYFQQTKVVLDYSNATRDFIINNVRYSIMNLTG